MNHLTDVLRFYQEIGVEFLELRRQLPSVTLEEINRDIHKCRQCSLHKGKTRYVPGEGSLTPEVMFIGEGPGETEDKFGRPFIGKAGQLLDRIIEKMGYTRETVFIGNIVKCRPPGNRDPQPQEVAACMPFLKRQIAVLAPRVLVCLGKVAMNNLLAEDFSISRMRGKVFQFEKTAVVATYHPSYVLHQKGQKAVSRAKWDIWQDMQVVLNLLKN